MIRRTTLHSVALILGMASGLAACDPMTDDHYLGEVQFSLSGMVANHRTVAPTDVNLYIVWNPIDSSRNDEGLYVAQRLEIHPSFPATFQLDVFGPPPISIPAENWHPLPETWITNGYIVAATSDADFIWFSPYRRDHPDPGILGIDPRHVIEYMPDGTFEGTLETLARHGTFSPGYHILDLKCIGPAKAAEIKACVDKYRPGGGPITDLYAALAECGSSDPSYPWWQASPLDLQTKLTVELIDDLEHYQPDPSDCI